MMRLVLAMLALLPLSSFGATLHDSVIRKEPQARTVGLGALGEVLARATADPAPAAGANATGEHECQSICDCNFPAGPQATNKCTAKTNHKLIMKEALCRDVANFSGVGVPDSQKNFKLTVEWEDLHPLGCFKDQGLYWFNAKGGPKPSGTLTGTPICWQPMHLNGTVDGNGGCPDGYHVIMDETQCRASASCLGYPSGTIFNTGESNSSQMLDHPQGCWINTDEVQATVYFNRPSAMGVGTNVKGTPICRVNSVQPAALGDPDHLPAATTAGNATVADTDGAGGE